MLKTIHLYGDLADRFGDEYRLDVLTPGEAIGALCVQLPGFEQAIYEGEFRCFRGEIAEGHDCDEGLLRLRLGSVKDFHVVPAAVGGKSGLGKILIGLVLLAAVFINPAFLALAPVIGGTSLAVGAVIAGVGGLMILGGVAQLISPHPKASNTTGQDQKQGFNFNGPVNTSEAGVPCPLVFGRVRAGSVVVSAGIISERIGASTTPFDNSLIPIGSIPYVGGIGPYFY